MEKTAGTVRLSFIAKRSVPRRMMTVLVYLSFCFSGFFYARGVLALFRTGNDIVAFFAAGIVPVLLFEGGSAFICRRASAMYLGEHRADISYAIRFFVVAANVAAGLIKLLYLPFPVLYPYGERLFSPVMHLLFLALFSCYALPAYFQRHEWGRALGYFGGWYLGLIFLSVMLKLFSGLFL